MSRNHEVMAGIGMTLGMNLMMMRSDFCILVKMHYLL
jgi:hypothetical protein